MEIVRKKLPNDRKAITHRFEIEGGHKAFLTVGLYEDGSPGEIFIRVSKEGSTMSGLLHSFCLAISMALQHGVPLKSLAEKFVHTRYEPAGRTSNPEIPVVTSITDYIFRWLGIKFLTQEECRKLSL